MIESETCGFRTMGQPSASPLATASCTVSTKLVRGVGTPSSSARVTVLRLFPATANALASGMASLHSPVICVCASDSGRIMASVTGMIRSTCH